jgi:lipid-A-disaccharide synthase-like uncharacterized protein
MILLEYSGIIGLLCILAAMIPSTWACIKAGKTDLPLRFSTLYFIGSFCLTIYALILGDGIFVFLNFLAFVQSLINFLYGVKIINVRTGL